MVNPEQDPVPPEGCTCGALWTVRHTHGKKDCPFRPGQDTGDELDRILRQAIKDAMNGQISDAVFVSGTRPQEAVDKAKVALLRLILKERRKQIRKILKHELEVWGDSRNESYLKAGIAQIDSELERSTKNGRA